MPFREAKIRRFAGALLANLDSWAAAAEEIAEHASPITGNKARGLHLARSILSAKNAIEHILRDAEES